MLARFRFHVVDPVSNLSVSKDAVEEGVAVSVNSLLTIIHRKHLITKAGTVYSLATRGQGTCTHRHRPPGKASAELFTLFYAGNLRLQEPGDDLVSIYCSALSLGNIPKAFKQFTVHASLQLSCQARYLSLCSSICRILLYVNKHQTKVLRVD